MWDYRAQVQSVHDGDTLTVTIDRGFSLLSYDMAIRLQDVFAPELKQTGGPETRQFVVDWINARLGAKWPFVLVTTRLPRADREDYTLNRYVGQLWTPGKNCELLNDAVQAFVKAQGYPGGMGS